MVRSRVIGTGSYAPEKILTNQDLEKIVDTSDAWITARTGIRERRIAAGETTSVMAAKAARAALKAAGVQPKDIDLVVTGTVTGELSFPSVSCLVQSALGLKAGVAALDVSAACSGFLFALDTADRYIRTGAAKKALVIGADRFSGIIDWKDRSTCVLFGDGAGAVVLGAEQGQRGVLSTHLHSDGKHWEMLYAPNDAKTTPFSSASTPMFLKMNGAETFKAAVRTMAGAINEALDANSLSPGDISLLIPHQANMRIINAIGERLGIPQEKVFTNLDKYGNTSAGSIPLALDEAFKSGRIKNNDIIIFVAFGGGFTWASAALRW